MPDSWLRREVLSVRRAIFNVLFYGSHLALFAYGWHSQATDQKLAALNTLEYSVWVSRGAGIVLAYNGGLILLPMLRNTLRVVRPKLSWLMPMDENLWFHRQVAYSMAFWTMVHVTAHYVNFINVERRQLRPELAVQIHYTQAGGTTGHVMMTIMLLMYTTATQKIRKQCFEAFWYTHHLAFFFMLALYSHATGCFVRDTAKPAYKKEFPFYDANHCLGYESWRFIIWPGLLYFGERVWREIRARRPTKLDKVLIHPSGAIELRMIKPSFRYVPGQWVFVQVPSVSAFEWHPFSISSAPEDPYVSVTMAQVGDWTEAVGTAVGAGPSVVAALSNATSHAEMVMEEKELPPPLYTEHNPSTPITTPTGPIFSASGSGSGPPRPSDQFYEVVYDGAAHDTSDPPMYTKFDISAYLVHVPAMHLPAVRIDGPYGAPSEDVFGSDLAVLVGAGIGATPFASVLKHIWYRQRSGKLGRLRRVEFIWICRDAHSLAWFSSVLREVEDAQVDPDFLGINMYITQKLSMDQLYNIAINSVGAEYDPLTQLRSRTFFGRPDFRAIYRRLQSVIEHKSFLGPMETGAVIKIGTFFCGPGALAKTVKKHALACSTPKAKFTFAKEHF